VLALKKVKKKRYPLSDPVKWDSLVLGFFEIGVPNLS
jgi:hypothetical protein